MAKEEWKNLGFSDKMLNIEYVPPEEKSKEATGFVAGTGIKKRSN
jgi:hypothetical protein